MFEVKKHSGVYKYSCNPYGFQWSHAPSDPAQQRKKKAGNQPWDKIHGISHPIVWPWIWKKANSLPLFVKIRGVGKVKIWLQDQDLKSFLEEFFRNWKIAYPLESERARFHYTHEERNLWKIWLLIGAIGVGGLGFSLFGDGVHSYRCSDRLEKGVLVPATVTKTKKNRRGNIVWDMSFTTQTGETISGRRTPIVANGYDLPTQGVGVVYSPLDNTCWDVSRSANISALNWAQRRFLTTLALGFGGFFSVLSVLLTMISLYKIFRPRPHKDAF